MSGASERANGRASGPVLTSRFFFVPDHSAMMPGSPVKIEIGESSPVLLQLRFGHEFFDAGLELDGNEMRLRPAERP